MRGRRCRRTKHRACGLFGSTRFLWLTIMTHAREYAVTLHYMWHVLELAVFSMVVCRSLVHLTRYMQETSDKQIRTITTSQTSTTTKAPWPSSTVLTGSPLHHSSAVSGPKSRGSKDSKTCCKAAVHMLSFMSLIGMNRDVHVLETRFRYLHARYR